MRLVLVGKLIVPAHGSMDDWADLCRSGPLPDIKKPPSDCAIGCGSTVRREAGIPTDSFSLIVIGAIALVAFWLVFSLVRKAFGLVLLVALAIGAWVLWSNPQLLHSVTGAFLATP
ncbi:MAG TPA: hypothetical protein DIT93_10285 [Pelagibacterium sp.]|nr:hypothetical protein [Pelagibacterium sp.]